MKLKKQYKQHQSIYNQGFRFDVEKEMFYTCNSVEDFIKPEGYEDWKVGTVDKYQYRNQRLEELGITEEQNKVRVRDKEGVFFESQIFTCSEYGDIDIIQYTLHRESILKEGVTTSAGTKWTYAAQRRFNPLYVEVTEGKYDFTDAKNSPFWHPSLIEKFENGDEVEKLVITEGQFKAFKATHDGIPTVGLTSISHFRDSETKTLHTDILEFIKKCKVKEVVILWDGDCRDISSSALANKEELTKRPSDFYWYAYNIEEHIREFFPAKGKTALKVFFATIKSDNIPNNPKGIDDLLIEKGVSAQRVLEDFDKIGSLPGQYLHWINISNDKGKKDMRKYFKLTSVNAFYGFHSERIKGQSFIFQNSTYRVEKNIPIIEVPEDLKNYVRIGVDYYKIQNVPFPKIGSRSNEVRHEQMLTQWSAGTIKFDHGKDALNHIPQYEGFTNMANHINYQKIVDGYWNLYDELDHELKEGDFPNIKILLKHLFQDHYDNELILDYLTILYRFPWRKLPVLCLVSKEQSTGKSTFIYLCKLIFKNNMAMINANDLLGDFNDHWTSKLIAASEETFLEKKEAYEAIKDKSTSKEITRKEKMKTARPIPNMLHFIFCSNYEDTFIKIGKEDSRLWITKVKTIQQKIEKFDEKLEAEIPYFVNFLVNREIKHPDEDRMWFAPDKFRTKAFENVVQQSQPTVVKDLRIKIREYFENFGEEELKVCVKDLVQYFDVPNRYGSHYINSVAQELLGAELEERSNRYHFKVPKYNEPDEWTLIKSKGRFLTFKKSKV